ncbi:MAG: EAL domain-containing protein [Pseudomonadota bacterium]
MFAVAAKSASSLPIRLTSLLICLVTLGIAVVASLGYARLSAVTADNASIRIDRAAKAAASTMMHATDGRFVVERGEFGRPFALRLTVSDTQAALQFSEFYDRLLAEIGGNNQGAANLFVLNQETQGFDRFATTFRRPDGSMPPPMSISAGHPAYAALAASEPFVGQVPVMGRLRLAYLTPILDSGGSIAGALAVDVGWIDDLTVARDELRVVLFGSAFIVLVLVAGFGIFSMTRETQPLRKLAQFANDMAAGKDSDDVPFLARKDEVGALAHGLVRVARLQDELEYLAYTDMMTGQGNRARYLRDLQASLTAAKDGKHFTLIHIDMVRFSRVNAAYGVAAGDQVLRYAGHVLSTTIDALDKNAKVARQGDDKFAILVEGTTDAAQAAELGKALIKALAEPIKISAGEVQLDAAVGICLLPQHASDMEDALGHADLALKAALSPDAERCIVFSPDLTDDTAREMLLESGLRKAFDEGGFSLHYQPQIDPASGRLTGVEALARWTHPTKGPIAPNEFIGVAERSGLIVDLGDWVLNEACIQARAWIDQGLVFDHVSVNVSAVQLWQQDFVAKVKDCLANHDLEGRYLCLELTESVFADFDDSCIVSILSDLRDLGITLSLDDFGSGYSSLGYLNKLPFDQLKIDGAFVRGAPRDRQQEKLLIGIVALGKGLGLSVVAEGAEEADEVDFVAKLGVAAVQGYFYSRPVPASDLTEAVTSIKARFGSEKEAA